jgi:hypothetical protein
MKKSELKQLIKVIVQEAVVARQQKLEESKGLSGFKKTPDSIEHTEKIATEKNLTANSEPKEKAEGKKLPVVKKPATPSVMKEDVVAMIREELEKHRTDEMAKRAAAFNPDTGILDASVSPDRRKPDPTSPTGYRLIGKFELKDPITKKVIQVVPDGTPITAPSGPYQRTSDNPNMGRPKKDATAPSTIPSAATSTSAGSNDSEDASEDDEDDEDDGDDQPMTSAKPNSKVIVKLNGKKIGNFDFRLPSGKISNDTMEKNLYRIEDLANYNLTPSVSGKYQELEDLFYDDKLPQGSTLDLVVDKSKSGEPSVVAK